MEKGLKTRICINCEGSMSFEDPFCPYCGQNQEAPPANREKAFTPPFKLVMPTKTEAAAIPAPLYRSQEVKSVGKPEDLLQAQVNAVSKKKETVAEEPNKTETETHPLSQNAKMRSFLLALILTMCGSTFLLFGLSLFLFGKEGMLTVHWKSSHWYLYLALSLPLFFLGWKSSNRLADEA